MRRFEPSNWQAGMHETPDGSGRYVLAEDCAANYIKALGELKQIDRPWTYCVDGLPAEPGRYEVMVVEPQGLKGSPPVVCIGVRWWQRRPGSSEHRQEAWDESLSGHIARWRPLPAVPALTQRDLAGFPERWLPAGFLEGLEP